MLRHIEVTHPFHTFRYFHSDNWNTDLLEEPVGKEPKHDGILCLFVSVRHSEVRKLPEFLAPSFLLGVGRLKIEKNNLKYVNVWRERMGPVY